MFFYYSLFFIIYFFSVSCSSKNREMGMDQPYISYTSTGPSYGDMRSPIKNPIKTNQKKESAINVSPSKKRNKIFGTKDNSTQNSNNNSFYPKNKEFSFEIRHNTTLYNNNLKEGKNPFNEIEDNVCQEKSSVQTYKMRGSEFSNTSTPKNINSISKEENYREKKIQELKSSIAVIPRALVEEINVRTLGGSKAKSGKNSSTNQPLDPNSNLNYYSSKPSSTKDKKNRNTDLEESIVKELNIEGNPFGRCNKTIMQEKNNDYECRNLNNCKELILELLKFTKDAIINLQKKLNRKSLSQNETLSINFEEGCEILCSECENSCLKNWYFYGILVQEIENYFCNKCFDKKISKSSFKYKKYLVSEHYNFHVIIEKIIKNLSKEELIHCENLELLAIRIEYLLEDLENKEQSNYNSISKITDSRINKKKGLEVSQVSVLSKTSTPKNDKSRIINIHVKEDYHHYELQKTSKLLLILVTLAKSMNGDSKFNQKRLNNYFPDFLINLLLESNLEDLKRLNTVNKIEEQKFLEQEVCNSNLRNPYISQFRNSTTNLRSIKNSSHISINLTKISSYNKPPEKYLDIQYNSPQKPCYTTSNMKKNILTLYLKKNNLLLAPILNNIDFSKFTLKELFEINSILCKNPTSITQNEINNLIFAAEAFEITSFIIYFDSYLNSNSDLRSYSMEQIKKNNVNINQHIGILKCENRDIVYLLEKETSYIKSNLKYNTDDISFILECINNIERIKRVAFNLGRTITNYSEQIYPSIFTSKFEGSNFKTKF